jgi:hypothetical protein
MKKKHLPGKIELSVFAVIAIIAAIIVASSRVHDLGLAALAIPIFIGAAIAGMARSGQFSQSPVAPKPADTETAVD